MAGLAALAKLNAVLLLAGYAIFLIFSAARRFDRLSTVVRKGALAAAGFLVSFGLPFGIMLAAVPGTFAGTIGFHLAKEKAAEPLLSLVFSRLGTLVGNHNYGLIPIALAGMILVPFLRDRRRALAAALLLASLAPIFLPGTFYLRYVVFAFAPLALFFGDGLRAFSAPRKARPALLVLSAALMLLTLAPSFSLTKLRAFDRGTRDLASYVAANTAPGEFVFGDDPGINFLARRPCPPRLVDVSGAMTSSGQVTAALIREECERAGVKLILVETEGPAHHLKNLRDYAAFEAYLRESFTLVRTARREFLGVEVWQPQIGYNSRVLFERSHHMSVSGNGFTGYRGVIAFVDLTNRRVSLEQADPALYRDYIGGRGVQARLIFDHLLKTGPLADPSLRQTGSSSARAPSTIRPSPRRAGDRALSSPP